MASLTDAVEKSFRASETGEHINHQRYRLHELRRLSLLAVHFDVVGHVNSM
jgi:hypothetical protein